MAVKLLMTWDILPDQEQAYFEFVVRDFIPKMQKLGLQPSDAWYTYYGNQPQMMTAALMSSLTEMDEILQSDGWHDLTQQLLDFVENFDYKIVQARSGFQI